MLASKTTRSTPRNTTEHQNQLQDHQNHTHKEAPKRGSLWGGVLMVLEVILVSLEVLLRVLEVTGPPVTEYRCIRDNYQDCTYVGTLDSLYQHTLIATGTMLRPVEATFLGHILGTKPPKNVQV